MTPSAPALAHALWPAFWPTSGRWVPSRRRRADTNEPPNSDQACPGDLQQKHNKPTASVPRRLPTKPPQTAYKRARGEAYGSGGLPAPQRLHGPREPRLAGLVQLAVGLKKLGLLVR